MVRLVARPFGFVSCWLVYLVRSWLRRSFTAIIRVVSNSMRIQCFMTCRSILRSDTTSSEIGFSVEQ
jgi:hypothetical protein